MFYQKSMWTLLRFDHTRIPTRLRMSFGPDFPTGQTESRASSNAAGQ